MVIKCDDFLSFWFDYFVKAHRLICWCSALCAVLSFCYLCHSAVSRLTNFTSIYPGHLFLGVFKLFLSQHIALFLHPTSLSCWKEFGGPQTFIPVSPSLMFVYKILKKCYDSKPKISKLEGGRLGWPGCKRNTFSISYCSHHGSSTILPLTWETMEEWFICFKTQDGKISNCHSPLVVENQGCCRTEKRNHNFILKWFSGSNHIVSNNDSEVS